MSTNKLRFSKRKVKEAGAAYLFIAPMVIGLLIFYFFAFIQNIYFSFNKVGAFGPPTFIGWDNYIRLVNDPLFWTALKNTLFYTVLGVPLVVGFSVVIAWLLNQKIKGQTLYRTAIFLPAITMPAAIGLLWRWLMNYQYGTSRLAANRLTRSLLLFDMTTAWMPASLSLWTNALALSPATCSSCAASVLSISKIKSRIFRRTNQAGSRSS